MIALALCCLAACAPGDGLQRAIAALRAGDARAAWIAAESETDEVQRDQAKVYVLHQAGDLEGALREAERGSRGAPGDPWLAERWAYIALSLKRARDADLALLRLDSAARGAPESERADWLGKLAGLRAEGQTLAATAQAREAADRRARAVALGLGALSIGVLVLLARRA